MHTIAQQERLTDAELAERAAGGDRDAFAALYSRYFQAIYDFATRIVRVREAAADVAQATFTRAWAVLQEGKRIDNVKAWLYAVAHNAAIDEVRRGKRLTALPEGEESAPLELARIDPDRFADPEAVLRDKELVELVWTTAAALSPQEYALLDLHVRRELDADELAESLGLKKGAVYTRLSRLKDSFEDAVTATLVAQRGRQDCPDLEALVAELGPAMTRELRAAVSAHLEACERCQETKRRYVSPLEILAGLAPVPITPELVDGVWQRVESETVAQEAVPAARPRWITPRTWVIAAIMAALAALAVLLALALKGTGPTVSDPTGARSTSHVIARPSTRNVIVVRWNAHAGARAFSIRFSHGPSRPDRVPELPGTATATRSAPLPSGDDWYFNLSTQGENGEWTNTVHLGPFVIVLPPQTLRPPTKRPPKVKKAGEEQAPGPETPPPVP